MPRPAPSTVPVNRPITKLPPPPLSLSKRSYPSAMSPPQIRRSVATHVGGLTAPVFSLCRPRIHDRFHRDTQAADEADHAAGLLAHVAAHPIGRIVDAIDGAVNRV